MTEELPYASEFHVPVLVDEVLEWLDVDEGRIYVDGTVGGGGHTQAILDASAPTGRVIAIDRDPEARQAAEARLADYGDRVQVIAGNYADTRKILDELGIDRVDGWLIDAGVSSHQFDDPERGFSFRNAGPLDMRMGPDAVSLETYLEEVPEKELVRVLKEYGEVRGAHRIARKLLEAFIDGKFHDTRQLADVVEKIVGHRGPAGRRQTIHPATLVFQALRIELNDELTGLEKAVESIPDVVKSGGRAVFISFHSLEDRIVKHGFRRLEEGPDLPKDIPLPAERYEGQAEVLTRKPVGASDEEVEANPRSRSAKLRALKVL